MDGHGGCTGGGWTTTAERDRYADVDGLPGGYLHRGGQRVSGEIVNVSVDEFAANGRTGWYVARAGVSTEGDVSLDVSYGTAGGDERTLQHRNG